MGVDKYLAGGVCSEITNDRGKSAPAKVLLQPLPLLLRKQQVEQVENAVHGANNVSKV